MVSSKVEWQASCEGHVRRFQRVVGLIIALALCCCDHLCGLVLPSGNSKDMQSNMATFSSVQRSAQNHHIFIVRRRGRC